MTWQYRQILWPESVRLSLPELKLLQKFPETTQRHEVAPYAFDKRGRPFQIFRDRGIDDGLDGQEADRIRVAIRDGTWCQSIEVAASAARQGQLSSDAVKLATDIVRCAFREVRQHDIGVDDEIEVVEPNIWKLELQLKDQQRKFGKLESALETLQRSYPWSRPPDRDGENSREAAAQPKSAELTAQRGSPSQLRLLESHAASSQERVQDYDQQNVREESSTRYSHVTDLPEPLAQSTVNPPPPLRPATTTQDVIGPLYARSGSGKSVPTNDRGLCPSAACSQLSPVFRKHPDELRNIPPFWQFCGRRDHYLWNIFTIAECGNEQFHSVQLIKECKAEHMKCNPPHRRIQDLAEDLHVSPAVLRRFRC
ncbi:hypothetical protein B0J12DRAFT_645485 [Macrophomina phaseolina]|uniref:Uncharacterized protein n=1 Tax=Macrophomina phaseolina TaxID=35725 RepID=A0ABQ8GRC0_9PEZI|nr:hypothetical protein B0J12DRAFT_645485 [Macrophomina phaseolina]